ncbi:MAG: ComF family protein [Alphaproteobacteria bacterium]|nr:ComF family protein [Alphaproteobacteria bacterium]
MPQQADNSNPEPVSRLVPSRTTELLRSAATWLTDLLTPPVCLACSEPIQSRDALCPGCWSEVDFIRPPLCDKLGIRLPYATGDTMISAAAAARPPAYSRARAVAHYEGTMRKLIHDLKFHDRHDVRRLMGAWLATSGCELIADADVLVPVPLSRTRLLSRRFNQSAILALEVSGLTGLKVRTQGLTRTRRTPTQVGLTRDQRRENVRGAFQVPPKERPQIAGKRVLLIDDIITTGATAEACTKALYSADAANVDIVALAILADPMRITT